MFAPCVTKLNLLNIYMNTENEFMGSVFNNYILIQYLNNFKQWLPPSYLKVHFFQTFICGKAVINRSYE